MRKISADYIFPISTEPIKNGVITIDKEGTILNIEHPDINNSEIVEYYDGVICPGFINSHCHLELSHLQNEISENKGMTGFITELIGKRFNDSAERIEHAIIAAETKMIKNGIVAVGDISNNNSTFKQKAKGELLYHTFIEIFSLDPNKAEAVFNTGIKLSNELSEFNLSNSIAPHAPYTMSEKLLTMINEYAAKNNSLLSIHNQESVGESELFIYKSGSMFDTFKSMGINTDLMRKTGRNSLKSTLPFLKDAKKLLLVHNTYSSIEDIRWAMSKENNNSSQELYWCTCPNANLFIENKLPDYNLFVQENAKLTIGTDSLASNWSLSILDEIKTITNHFPEISLQTLLTWATKNGADFLNFNQLGVLEKGKKPGLNVLTNIENLKVSDKTDVIKLI